MGFIQTLSPSYVPASSKGKSELVILRERILQVSLISLTLFGFPAVILGIKQGLEDGSALIAGIYIAIYASILLMTVSRKIPYGIRGHVTTVVMYLLAVSEIFGSGMLGEVRTFLLAFCAMTAVLFNYKNVIASILLSIATIIGIGIYVMNTPVLPIPVLKNFLMGTDWVTSSTVFVLFAATISGSVTIIITGLESTLGKQAELTQSLEYERDTLEDRIRERTRSMSRRMAQLRAASEISRTISELGESEGMLNRVVERIKERFDLYYVGAFLLDQSKQNVVLRAGTGEAGKHMLMDGHQLAVGGSSMIGWCVSNRKSRIALDVGTEAVRFNNPNLPLTRSELALPIVARNEVLGALTVQSDRANAFDESDITILQGVADSLAIALENDRLYTETRQSLEEIRSLNRAYIQQSWAETIESYGNLSYRYENPLISGSETAPVNVIEVPLVLRNEVIGHVALEMEQADLDDDALSFIDNVTTQTAIALENARLLNETERRAVQEQKLNELASRFSRSQSIDEILRAAAQELGQLPTVGEVSIQMNTTISEPNDKGQPAGGRNGKEHA